MQKKYCELCGIEIPFNNKGKVRFLRRRFCSTRCHGNSAKVQNPKRNSCHKYAQRHFKATECSKCGKKDARLHRHHIDRNPRNNSPGNIAVLCSRCHADTHVAGGTWGPGPAPLSTWPCSVEHMRSLWETILGVLTQETGEDLRSIMPLRMVFPLCSEKVECRSSILKGYGNAIVPELAAEFIKAVMQEI